MNMNVGKKAGRAVGALFITATVAGIISVISFGSTLATPVDLPGIYESKSRVLIGALFYFVLAAACASITIPMYPILKKHSPGLALGAVGFRIIEGIILMIGVINVLSLVTLSQAFVGAGAPDNSHFQTLGELLLAGQDLAQSLVVEVFTFSLGALMYHWIFYQTKLVPRWLSVWGLVAVALVFISGLVSLFGGPSLSTVSELLNLPNFVNELVLAVWLIVKGFSQEETQKGATNGC